MYRVYAKEGTKNFHKSDCYIYKNNKSEYNKYAIEEMLIAGKKPCLKCFNSIETINSKVKKANNDFLHAHLSKKERIIWLYYNTDKHLFKSSYYLYKKIPNTVKNISSEIICNFIKPYLFEEVTFEFYDVFKKYLLTKGKIVSFNYQDFKNISPNEKNPVKTNEKKITKENTKKSIKQGAPTIISPQEKKLNPSDYSWKKNIILSEMDSNKENLIREIIIRKHDYNNGKNNYLFSCTLISVSNNINVYLNTAGAPIKLGNVATENIIFIREELEKKKSMYIAIDKFVNKSLYFVLVHIADNDNRTQNLLISKFNNAVFNLKNAKNHINTEEIICDTKSSTVSEIEPKIESNSWRKRVVGTKYNLKENVRAELYKKLVERQEETPYNYLFDCELEHEIYNSYDVNAIKVSLKLDKPYFIGYIARDDQGFINKELENKTSMKLVLINNTEQGLYFDIVHIKKDDFKFQKQLLDEYRNLIESRKKREKENSLIYRLKSSFDEIYEEALVPLLIVVLGTAIVISPILLIYNIFSRNNKSEAKQQIVENIDDSESVSEVASTPEVYEYRMYNIHTLFSSTNSHVGHDWGTKNLTCYKNSEEIDIKNIVLKPGDILQFNGTVYENDSSPDSAEFESTPKHISKSELQADEIKISSYKATVREDLGRYAGESTEVTVTIVLQPVD